MLKICLSKTGRETKARLLLCRENESSFTSDSFQRWLINLTTTFSINHLGCKMYENVLFSSTKTPKYSVYRNKRNPQIWEAGVSASKKWRLIDCQNSCRSISHFSSTSFPPRRTRRSHPRSDVLQFEDAFEKNPSFSQLIGWGEHRAPPFAASPPIRFEKEDWKCSAEEVQLSSSSLYSSHRPEL